MARREEHCSLRLVQGPSPHPGRRAGRSQCDMREDASHRGLGVVAVGRQNHQPSSVVGCKARTVSGTALRRTITPRVRNQQMAARSRRRGRRPWPFCTVQGAFVVVN
jgi:hypothetical protein